MYIVLTSFIMAMNSFHFVKIKLIGVRTVMKKLMIGAENMEKSSDLSLAIFLGVISPNMRTTTVMTIVAIVALVIYFEYRVAMSDLPDWIKYLILK